MHSFTGSPQDAQKLLEFKDLYIGDQSLYRRNHPLWAYSSYLQLLPYSVLCFDHCTILLATQRIPLYSRICREKCLELHIVKVLFSENERYIF